jgi:hypothetical protein
MLNIEKIELLDGKYTMIYDPNKCELKTLRYGEPWREHIGDNLIYCLVQALLDERKKNVDLKLNLEGITKS